LTESDGSTYEGEFKNGEMNGQGTYTYPDGEKKVGEFKDGEIWNGQGTEIVTFGGMEGTDKYEGGFKNGKSHGQGKYTTYNGLIYEGEHKDGLRNGQGTETGPSGEKYVGEFKDGWRNGQGTLTSYDGSKYVGEFKNDKEWNTKYYDKNGNIMGKIVNGVKQE